MQIFCSPNPLITYTPPNDLVTHNNATFAKFKTCLLIQITVRRYQVRLLNRKQIGELYIHGREKVLSSARIMTVRLNMSTTVRNNIHLYPLESYWLCKFILLESLNYIFKLTLL